MEMTYFTADERRLMLRLTRELIGRLRHVMTHDDMRRVWDTLSVAAAGGHLDRDMGGFNPIVRQASTALLLCQNVVADRNLTIATMIYPVCHTRFMTMKQVNEQWGDDVTQLVHGLMEVSMGAKPLWSTRTSRSCC